METVQLIDNTTIFDSCIIKSSLYKRVVPLCTKSNAVHYSLSFRSGIPVEEMKPLIDRFLKKLTEATGLHSSRIGMVGLLLTEPDCHAHLVCISGKDRNTGKSIRNIPLAAVQEIFNWWENEAGSNVKSRKVYDADRLRSYHAGWKNACRPGQKGEEIIHGQSFIKRLETKQAKRSMS